MPRPGCGFGNPGTLCESRPKDAARFAPLYAQAQLTHGIEWGILAADGSLTSSKSDEE